MCGRSRSGWGTYGRYGWGRSVGAAPSLEREPGSGVGVGATVVAVIGTVLSTDGGSGVLHEWIAAIKTATISSR